MTAALEGGEWSAARPGRTLPPEKTRYPFHRRLDGPQGRSEWAENLVPTGIRSRTVQPVVQSLYRQSYRAHRRIYYIIQYCYYTTGWPLSKKIVRTLCFVFQCAYCVYIVNTISCSQSYNNITENSIYRQCSAFSS